jgi:hypothetical protein
MQGGCGDAGEVWMVQNGSLWDMEGVGDAGRVWVVQKGFWCDMESLGDTGSVGRGTGRLISADIVDREVGQKSGITVICAKILY